ncbi:hypothetical protein Cni_G19982 [Canna indica]|uniref:Uncharacterized protein n=1 Tax=Canna indica TaxID=4628 RepID=A0AAQ3QHE4_9LILI|nr:hypothetical protein Cni_G19982 [Canna indica]
MVHEATVTDDRKLLLPPLPPPAAGGRKLSADNKLLMRRRGFQVPAALNIAPAAAAAAAAAASAGTLCGKDGKEYTSLRDIISWPPPPSGMASPTTPGGAGCGGGEIRIKNRLVQQAAQAYLQPTPTAASHRRRELIPTCGDFFSRFLQFLGGICRSICRSLCPLR